MGRRTLTTSPQWGGHRAIATTSKFSTIGVEADTHGPKVGTLIIQELLPRLKSGERTGTVNAVAAPSKLKERAEQPRKSSKLMAEGWPSCWSWQPTTSVRFHHSRKSCINCRHLIINSGSSLITGPYAKSPAPPPLDWFCTSVRSLHDDANAGLSERLAHFALVFIVIIVVLLYLNSFFKTKEVLGIPNSSGCNPKIKSVAGLQSGSVQEAKCPTVSVSNFGMGGLTGQGKSVRFLFIFLWKLRVSVENKQLSYTMRGFLLVAFTWLIFNYVPILNTSSYNVFIDAMSIPLRSKVN